MAATNLLLMAAEVLGASEDHCVPSWEESVRSASRSARSSDSISSCGSAISSNTDRTHSSVEKRRRAFLSQRYQELRSVIPSLNTGPAKASNVAILQGASAYIKALQKEEENLVETVRALREEQHRLRIAATTRASKIEDEFIVPSLESDVDVVGEDYGLQLLADLVDNNSFKQKHVLPVPFVPVLTQYSLERHEQQL